MAKSTRAKRPEKAQNAPEWAKIGQKNGSKKIKTTQNRSQTSFDDFL